MSDYKAGINVKKNASIIRGILDLDLLMYTRNLLAEWNVKLANPTTACISD